MELQDLLEDFQAKGIQVIAISANDQETAERTRLEWELDRLPLGYGLGREQGETWGLFYSSALKDTEPDPFHEPGLFVVRADGTLYASIVQTMPFARPPMKAFLGTLDWIIENDFPARGEA